AFALSVVVGLAVGLAVGLHVFSRRSFMPIILLLYGMPQITILPLFILYFGIGAASKIAFGFTHGTFAIIVTVAAGGEDLQPTLDGRRPVADLSLRDLSAHDPELLHRHAARHDRRAARRAVGGTLRLDRWHRLFHDAFHPELRSDQAPGPGRDARRHGDRAQ